MDDDPAIITLCGELLAGNYSIQGDVRDWAAAALETRRKVTPVVEKLLGPVKFEIAGLGNTDFDKFTNFPGSYAASSQHEVILERVTPPDFFTKRIVNSNHKVDHYADARIPYIVKININGSEKDVVLDSGSSMSLFRVAVAQRLGIVINPTPYIQNIDVVTSNPRSPAQEAKSENEAHLGLIKKMTLEGMGKVIHLENVPVAVGGHVDILGMNVLTKMDSILLTERHLVLNVANRPNSCDEPLRIASKSMGAYLLVLRYHIDGVMRNVMLDTGDNSYLSGTGSAHVSAVAKDYTATTIYDLAGLDKTRYFKQGTTFGVGKLARHLKIRVYPDEHVTYGYVLGASALRDFNVYINFKRRVACLEPLAKTL